MSFQVKEPILVVGLGGVGSKLAYEGKENLKADCLLISNDQKDLKDDCKSVKISTESIVNPSVQLIRGFAYKESNNIRNIISNYSTVILITNMAGKGGQGISPVVSQICKDLEVGLISFAIMPFKFEKERIFGSGIAFKRIRENSDCTIVLDNDSLLESNPDLSIKECHNISNSAIFHVFKSIGKSDISINTNILVSSKNGNNIEESLKDSLKMLYENAPPTCVKRSIIYVAGGEKIPVGVLNSISGLSEGILSESNTQVDIVNSFSDESRVIMLSSIQGMTKFENYDPLGIIPQENTLDWSNPDCSIDCNLDLYQLE